MKQLLPGGNRIITLPFNESHMALLVVQLASEVQFGALCTRPCMSL